MKNIFILFIIFSNFLLAQKKEIINDILNENNPKLTLNTQKFINKDFSKIWNSTENLSVFGIIGEGCERLRIKLISIKQNPKNTKEYFVTGKSKVKNTIDDFSGKIIIEKIYTYPYPQIVCESTDEIKYRGLIVANYEFLENKNQIHSGKFSGKLYSKFFIDRKNQMKYDILEGCSDGYFNNAFVGKWTMYNSKISKISNWGDYRVPLSPNGFDIGTGEFSPNEIYLKNGWQTYRDISTYNPNPKSLKIEKELWWK